MHPFIARTLRFAAPLGFCFLTLPAHAGLPQSASVPGGVAVVPLGSAAGTDKPQSWLGDQPVLVTADQGQWFAVVGLSLDTKPGPHELTVKSGGASRAQSFEVAPKQYLEQHITLKDKSKVELAPTDLARAEREIALIKQLKRHWRDAPDNDFAFLQPVAGKLGGRFGVRRFFNGEPRAPHAGLDMAAASGTPVKSAAPGQVLAVGDYFFNGKTVFVDHGNGLITLYCHLERIDVKAGESVEKGRQLGLSGMSGRASGPHLHWSVVLNGAMVDPELFIPAQPEQ